MLKFNRMYQMAQQWFAALGVMLFISSVALAGGPAISDPSEKLPNGTEVPGIFPESDSLRLCDMGHLAVAGVQQV